MWRTLNMRGLRSANSPGSSMHGNRDERDRPVSRAEQRILADVIATMMAQSPAQEVDAGLLIYRVGNGPEVLLVQPGGPFWSKKNGRTWSIPKGVVEPGDVLAAVRRQFTNDTGLVADGDFLTLAPIEQKGGKILQGFAVECDLDLRQFRSSEFSLEWPPASGRFERFPEIEQIQYFDLRLAVQKILPPQWPLLLEISETLGWSLRPREQK
jgi:predicted NUDIX family NTP pyrophosphohydrolase